MEAGQRMAIEWECAALANAFAYYIDNREYPKVGECFTEDGVFHRDGKQLVGRRMIVEALEQRPLEAVTRHVTTGYHFSHVDADEAIAHSTNRSYFAMAEGGVLPASRPPAQMVLLDFTDRFRRTEAGWRIAERRTSLVFIDDTQRALFGLPAK